MTCTDEDHERSGNCVLHLSHTMTWPLVKCSLWPCMMCALKKSWTSQCCCGIGWGKVANITKGKQVQHLFQKNQPRCDSQSNTGWGRCQSLWTSECDYSNWLCQLTRAKKEIRPKVPDNFEFICWRVVNLFSWLQTTQIYWLTITLQPRSVAWWDCGDFKGANYRCSQQNPLHFSSYCHLMWQAYHKGMSGV